MHGSFFFLSKQLGVRYCIPSVVVESTLPIYTHAPEPDIILHDPAGRDAIPLASALKSTIPLAITPSLHSIDSPEHQQQRRLSEEKVVVCLDEIKEMSTQNNAETSISNTTLSSATPPELLTISQFPEGHVRDLSDSLQDQQNVDHSLVLDCKQVFPSNSPSRRGYASTPSSPISSPTVTHPQHSAPSNVSLASSSPRKLSFQGNRVKRSSTAAHSRSNSTSSGGVRFQRGLGSPSVGVLDDNEEEDSKNNESSYPTFAAYRQAQHANFSAFAQRMRRLEAAAATASLTNVTNPITTNTMTIKESPNEDEGPVASLSDSSIAIQPQLEDSSAINESKGVHFIRFGPT
ncbi:hypothetical protein FBU30_000606 [Linnemannia zychae]|nr:hypothetical protein FBU30_000606 [Linnemannia zychae]